MHYGAAQFDGVVKPCLNARLFESPIVVRSPLFDYEKQVTVTEVLCLEV
jgi:hypothetical protein